MRLDTADVAIQVTSCSGKLFSPQVLVSTGQAGKQVLERQLLMLSERHDVDQRSIDF